MGYDVHITRAESWSENEGEWISAEEWDAVVRADPELHFCPENGDHFAEWTSDVAQGWLNWNEGNVYTKNPDDALLRKMCDLATRLNANVQGDDGERYPAALEVRAPEPSNFAYLSLVLTALSLCALLLSFWLDRGHIQGEVRPMARALPIAALVAIFGLTWFCGAGVAVVSWFVGRKNAVLSLVAVAASMGVAAILLLFG